MFIKCIFIFKCFKTSNLINIHNLKFVLVQRIKFNNSYLNTAVKCFNRQ